MDEDTFKKLVRHDGKRLFRDMPWRVALPDGTYNPYRILVSEMMLQQTQVSRVIPKFEQFLKAFPTVKSLADARLAEVLKQWSGLGYNRRAKYLHDAAQSLVDTPLPWTYEALIACKGIGPNTAKAVLVYAYDLPEIFIETNIRTVFIHYFYKDQASVSDKEILALHARTLDTQLPRACYWALMDIGAYIKATEGNASKQSSSYKKQPKFEGSLRQVRGTILKSLADTPKTLQQLGVKSTDKALHDLTAEKLIHKKSGKYYLGGE